MNTHIPFSIPAYETVDPNSGVMPPEGWQDCTMTGREASVSKNGNGMMVVEWTIDNGNYAGINLSEYIVFGLQGGFGEAKLRTILDAHGGIEWVAKPFLDEFVNQFPTNTIRAGVRIEYEYQIKDDDDRWVSVSQDKYEKHTGRKSIKAKPAEYRGVSAPRQIQLSQPEMATAPTDNLPF